MAVIGWILSGDLYDNSLVIIRDNGMYSRDVFISDISDGGQYDDVLMELIVGRERSTGIYEIMFANRF